MKVLEISPYEPPASGWVTRIKLLRQIIEGRGGTCEILDIGPSRRVDRPGCIPVMGGRDYLVKVVRFVRAGFTIHCHINAEYFRGLLLGLAAAALARLFRTRCVVTFHGGPAQEFFAGWRRVALTPLFELVFLLAHSVVCNSQEMKNVLGAYVRSDKIQIIPAFSVQYLSHREVDLDADLERFLSKRLPLISTYFCFRDGFFTDTVVEAVSRLVAEWPNLGLVIVGTGPGRQEFERSLQANHLEKHVALAGDLQHDAFMTLLRRTAVHLRTPITDGVSATVLEALWLRVPVVASDNGARPAGVMTYPAADARQMAEALDSVLRQRAVHAATLPPMLVEDTAGVEVDVLLGAPVPARSPALVNTALATKFDVLRRTGSTVEWRSK